MATKKELVASILQISEVDTKENLLAKKNTELEAILEDLQESEAVTVETEAPTVVAPHIAVAELMEQMKAEMLAELKEQARKEVEAEQAEATKAVSALDVVAKPTKKKDIDRFEPIPVMNVTNGQLVYISKKTGAEWIWSEYGDVEYLEFQEILTMKSGQRRFFDEPFLIILDEDAVEYVGLTKMYEKLVDLQSLDKVITLDQASFEKVMETSPKGIKLTIIQMIKEKLETEEISMKKINYLNKKFNTDISRG